MDWKSDLRRTQSVKSIPSSCDKPTWTDAGLRDKTVSVSQLVSRYQTAVKVNKLVQATSGENAGGKTKQALKEIPPSPQQSTDTRLESLIRRNKETDVSPAKSNLSRSKSEGSLQNSGGSIETLKALFESKTAAQNKVKSNVRAASVTSTLTASMPVMNGEAGDVRAAAEEQKIPAEKTPKKDAKLDHVTQKVVTQTLVDHRKTIGGIDFEKIAASQAEEKRRSIADFRENSFIQTKETLSISVKAISALYLSKVANHESRHSVNKPGQDQARGSAKRVKFTKMAEDSQQKTNDLPQLPSERHQLGLIDISGTYSQQPTPSQLSKEMLYQQRQKCELRRLLKHTHPELKMLDDAVDEEFAEVLSSESATAGETGYEGEVLSRCLIFENCGLSSGVPPYAPKIHMAKGAAERKDISKTSAAFEASKAEPHTEIVKGMLEDDKVVDSRLDLNKECEDEMVRIDVRATRRIFENQSRPDQKKFQGIVSMSGEDTKAVKVPVKQTKMSCRENPTNRSNTNSEEQPQIPPVCQSAKHGCEEVLGSKTHFEKESEAFSAPEKHSDTIKTSAALFKNNPFISANVEKEHSHGHASKPPYEAGEDYVTANVKNRTHLFESMPFDKIRHQNKDEIETLVENIKETLNFLYRVKAIHSAGAIIEVNETMIARKAKFILSESGPEIKYDEVAEGGAQNFILQLLPRANLKPQITYLKENSKECMEATVVGVPVQQHHFSTNKDSEFKTANVVQLVEDILNQDNSLRKGVIIQEDINTCADVIVYSLYKYVNEKDVKSYSPPRGVEYGTAEPGGDVRTKSNPPETSQDQAWPLLIRPEMKGNVKLFKSCIEKGDLEYLKILQAEPTVQEPELPQNQAEAGQDKEPHCEQTGDPTGEVNAEWVPVDVKRLKNMFSGDRSHIQEGCVQSAKTAHVSHRKGQSSAECNADAFTHQQIRDSGGQSEEVCNFKVVPEDDNKTQQAELVDMDETKQISDFQTAIHNLQQTTMEAKSFCHSLQEMQETLDQESSDKSTVSVIADDVTHSRTEAELPQKTLDQSVESSPDSRWNKLPSASDIPVGQKSDWQYKNTETFHEDSCSEKVQTEDTWNKNSQDHTESVQEQHIQTSTASERSSEGTPAQEEVVLQGSVQAALKSLERSNINVNKGDFKAAMIYRNSNKTHQERPQNVDATSAQKPNTEESRHMTEPDSSQRALGQEVTSQNTGSASKKSKRSRGPKPAIPPKPKHLMAKQEDKESSQQAHKDPPTHINTRTTEASQVPRPSPETPDQCENERKQDLFKTTNESVHHQRNQLLGEDKQMLKETEAALESSQKDGNANTGQQEINAAEEKTQGKDSMSETDESPVDFHKACQKFESKTANVKKNAPAKPKRVKAAQASDTNPPHLPEGNTRGEPAFVNMKPKPQQSIADPSTQTCRAAAKSRNKNQTDVQQESKVEMREKKPGTETENERRQRLSVHMDEIMRGNTTAAMEIFENLRKQEQLQSILSRVEEIEQETSEVDVKSLRKVFEDVPDWVVNSEKKKPKRNRAKNKEKSRPCPKDRAENKSSMAHVYGDLERASEEIMNLKEQTLARLMDIEEAIKKALYSVSALKSDTDIAGLSCLFKESLGTVQGSSSNGRMKSQETAQINTSINVAQGAGTQESHAKQQPSPPSSPAFISIQSAARKVDKTGAAPAEASICPARQQSPKLEEKFRSTKTLTCNSPAQNRRTGRRGRQKQSANSPLNSNRELSVLEVQTDSQGKSITGTKTITNCCVSSKTSAVVEALPERVTMTSQAISPSTCQVAAHPGNQPPVNHKNT